MKFIKSYKIFESFDKELCNRLQTFGIIQYSINEDGSIDCDQDVIMNSKRLNDIPFNFNKITGFFTIISNNIKSLKNCPKYISSDFDCPYNQLTSLEYGPEYVGRNYYCNNNQLITLKGCIEEVYGRFYCNNNLLTSLEFCPMDVNDDFDCSNNQLEYLDRSPLVKKDFICYGMFKSEPEFSGDCRKLLWI